MMLQHEPPRNLPDQVIRDSLKNRANLREFLHAAVPELAAGFDYDRAEEISREFPMEDWRVRTADLPLEIPYRTAEGEGRALVCVLIEHQSDTDPLNRCGCYTLAWGTGTGSGESGPSKHRRVHHCVFVRFCRLFYTRGQRRGAAIGRWPTC